MLCVEGRVSKMNWLEKLLLRHNKKVETWEEEHSEDYKCVLTLFWGFVVIMLVFGGCWLVR
jgi:hypothetical protein